MPAEEAVIDAPVLDAGAEPVAKESQADVAPEQTEFVQPDVKGDERTIPKRWKEYQQTTPGAYNDLKNLFFAKKTLEEKLTGLNLDEMRPWLDENGGQQGISERLTELAGKSEELDGLYGAINSGDTSIIDKIPEEQLAPIATAAFERMAQTNPEAWQAYQSNVFAATINQAGILPFLDKMEMMLQYNDVQNLPALVQQLKGWAQSFSQTASQQPQRPGATQGKQPQKTEAQIRQELQKETDQERYYDNVGTQAQTARTAEIDRQLVSFYDRRKDDTEAKDAAREMLNQRVNQRMTADTGLQKQLQQLAAKRDMPGALRLIASREKAVIDQEAPKVGRTIFGQPSAAPAPKPDKQREEVRTPPHVHADPKKAFLSDLFAR